jgi:hypothetical protein
VKNNVSDSWSIQHKTFFHGGMGKAEGIKNVLIGGAGSRPLLDGGDCLFRRKELLCKMSVK